MKKILPQLIKLKTGLTSCRRSQSWLSLQSLRSGFFATLLAILSMAVLLAASLTACASNEKKYTSAMALYDEGKFEEALKGFSALGDYSDSAAYARNILSARKLEGSWALSKVELTTAPNDIHNANVSFGASDNVKYEKSNMMVFSRGGVFTSGISFKKSGLEEGLLMGNALNLAGNSSWKCWALPTNADDGEDGPYLYKGRLTLSPEREDIDYTVYLVDEDTMLLSATEAIEVEESDVNGTVTKGGTVLMEYTVTLERADKALSETE